MQNAFAIMVTQTLTTRFSIHISLGSYIYSDLSTFLFPLNTLVTEIWPPHLVGSISA